MKKTITILSAVLISVLLLVACEDKVNKPIDGTNTYRVEAVLVKYMTNGAAKIDLVLMKNGEYFKEADISLAGFTLDTCVCGYCLTFSPGQILADSNYVLNITDSTMLDIDLTITLPGELTSEISDLPVSRIYSGGSVNVDWTVSDGTEGYILATVPPDTLPADSGYEDYVDGLSEAIPPDAFNFNQLSMLGKHDVYVAAYTGAPTAADGIPFGIPVANNPPDSSFSSRLTGRIAGMVITAPDSVILPTP